MNYKNKYYKYKLKYLLAKKKTVGGGDSPKSPHSSASVSNQMPQEDEWYVPGTPEPEPGYVAETPESQLQLPTTPESQLQLPKQPESPPKTAVKQPPK